MGGLEIFSPKNSIIPKSPPVLKGKLFSSPLKIVIEPVYCNIFHILSQVFLLGQTPGHLKDKSHQCSTAATCLTMLQ